MGLIINIDQSLEQRTEYNILKEPLNDMLKNKQELWEKENPIDMIFNRSTIDGFQETYTSAIGFDHAFAETSDYAVAPIFNSAEGFSATYRTRTFQGGFIITQQVLEDRQYRKAKDDASAFMKRWHGDIVEYAIKSLSGGFKRNDDVEWGSSANGGVSRLKLTSADTVSGDIDDVKNPLFCKNHTIVKRKGMTNVRKQSNIFYIDVDLAGDDAARLTKLADGINQVVTIMENYRDDNDKRADVGGMKDIVAPNNARLKAALNTVLSMDMFNEFGQPQGPNPCFKRANLKTTAYLNDIEQCEEVNGTGRGFFIVDKAYNAENHGPELTERIPLTLNVENKKNPYGISYDGRQRFDINSASWRGIAYVYIGKPAGAAGAWDNIDNFTEITPAATIVKEVRVVNTTAAPVNTKAVQ